MFLQQLKDTYEDPHQGGFALPVPAIETPVKKPSKLSVAFLQAADIDAFVEIQTRIRAALVKDYHLKERNAEDIAYHLDQRMTGVIVKAHQDNKNEDGIVVGGCLISYMGNDDRIKNMAGYPIETAKKPVTAAIQTLCVDPAYARQGISGLILETAFCVAAEKRMTHIVSAIADDNEPSIRTFKSAGYKPFAQGIDDRKGYAKTYYRLSLFGCNAA